MFILDILSRQRFVAKGIRMSCITITPNVFMLHLTNQMCTQYWDCNPLLLTKRRDSHSFSSQNLVISVDSFPASITEIKSATLELPIQRIVPYHVNCQNNIIIRPYFMKKSDKIHVQKLSPIIHPILPVNIYNNMTCSLDIICLLKEWQNIHIETFTIMLELQFPNLSLEITNLKTICPQLHIVYSTSSPTPHTHPASMLSLSMVNQQKAVITSKERLIFDHMCLDHSSDIGYNMGTGKFTVHTAGYYYIHWILNLLGCCQLSCICISMNNETTGETLAFHSPCIMPCQICGQHILEVTQNETTYSLINNSSSSIQLTNIETQATLIFIKL